MDIKNGAKYESNYARAAACFLGTCAPRPEGQGRQAAYDLITGIYSLIAADPVAMGFKSTADVWFEPWEQQKGREKDIKAIRCAIAKIDGLVLELFNLVEASELDGGCALLPEGTAPGRTLKKVLAGVGVAVEGNRLTAEKGCFEALKELAAISRSNTIHITDGAKEDKAYLYFSRCVFDPASNWQAMAFDRLLDADGRLVWLCRQLEQRGYTRIDCFEGKAVSLDYVIQHGKKAEPIKKAWSERTHSGISLSFEELRLESCFIWVRMPMFQTVLSVANTMPDSVSAFIAASTKTCTGCRYCVQTDKTGQRPIAAIMLDGKGKCPLFPGFTMNWRSLSQELADNILALLDAIVSLPELK